MTQGSGKRSCLKKNAADEFIPFAVTSMNTLDLRPQLEDMSELW